MYGSSMDTTEMNTFFAFPWRSTTLEKWLTMRTRVWYTSLLRWPSGAAKRSTVYSIMADRSRTAVSSWARRTLATGRAKRAWRHSKDLLRCSGLSAVLKAEEMCTGKERGILRDSPCFTAHAEDSTSVKRNHKEDWSSSEGEVCLKDTTDRH